MYLLSLLNIAFCYSTAACFCSGNSTSFWGCTFCPSHTSHCGWRIFWLGCIIVLWLVRIVLLKPKVAWNLLESCSFDNVPTHPEPLCHCWNKFFELGRLLLIWVFIWALDFDKGMQSPTTCGQSIDWPKSTHMVYIHLDSSCCFCKFTLYHCMWKLCCRYVPENVHFEF